MRPPRICPNCRAAVPADAPEGVCPACALRAGFEVTKGPGATVELEPAARSRTLPVEQLARRLPELEQFELIGQGGMGAVYKAMHRKLGRPVAVKVLDPNLQDRASFAERFTREARTLAQLDHPNVVSVYDFGHRDDLYYLIMEFVDGVNLRQTIEAGRLTPNEALSLVPHICEALQYAHDKGVIHRDIKPENILVDVNGVIKIADFGLAKLIGGNADQRLTRTEQIMGTPNYMAPEQIESPNTVDHRADIYALGVVFYELLTGELPVGRFPPPSNKVEVDVRLDSVVLRTLEKEPSLRYQQASELRSDVESLASGGPLMADPAGSRSAAPQAKGDYEYRSPMTLFGWPLIHIHSSRDPEGKQMRVASGVIAIGDVALGAIALGAISVGGVSLGGVSVGLFGFGGVTLGLLTALGGVAIGSFSAGGVGIGLVSHGAVTIEVLKLASAVDSMVSLAGWLAMTLAITVGAVAGASAWANASKARVGRKGS